MTGSENDRFLLRSVRNSNIPTSITKELDPGKLISRRILNHEKRILNENRTNKVIYDVGQRVRIQNVKTKLFDKFGTIKKQRVADDGSIVSYVIRKDDGWKSYRHRRHLRKLEPEHDPLENTNLSEVDESDDDEIPQLDRHSEVGNSRKPKLS